MIKVISIKRKTRLEPRYHPKMGRLTVPVTRIEKTFLGVPFKLIHKYRETYNGKTKDCVDCVLSKV